MKRTAFLLLLFILLTATGFCQQQPSGHFDDWGRASMEELKLTECSFDKSADAVLLLDLAQVYYSKEEAGYYTSGKFRITTAYFQRFKVFTDKGTRRANHKLTLRISSKEEVKNVRGIAYNLVKGVLQKTYLDQEDIHTTNLNQYENQVTFTVPGVTAGSVFEVGYEREQDVSYTLPVWYFTSDVPSVKSSLTVGFLDALSYYVDKHYPAGAVEEKSQPFTSDIMISGGFYGRSEKPLTGTAVTYTTHNLKAFHPEPYTNSSRNYMSWVGFQLKEIKSPLDASRNATLVSSFSKLSDMLYDDNIFASGLNDEPVPGKFWKPLINDTMSRATKTHVIYDYIRSNVKWNGNSGIKPTDGNGKTWKNKTGSRSDINLLLLSTLRSAHVIAYPMLIGSRYRGSINVSYPILDEYIGLDVLVEPEEDQDFILDATNRVLPFGEPGSDQLNTMGLVLKSKGEHFWYSIHDRAPSAEKIVINAALDDDGSIRGTADIIYTNHMAEDMIRLKNTGNQTMLNDVLKKQMPNATLESATDTIVQGSQFIFTVKFTVQPPMDNIGNIYLTVPTLYGNSVNPFVNKDRISDVDFGHRDMQLLSMQITIPSSYTVDSVFRPVSLGMSDTSAVFMSEAEVADGAIVWQQRRDYRQSFYKSEDYPAFFDFERKYYELREKPVVLHKNN